MNSVYDAAIVGGGPSGLYAARLLAERGLKVVLLEKKAEIGADVICTGIVGREIFREFSLPSDSVLNDLQTIKLTLSSSRALTYRHPAPFAVIVDRKKFDQDLTRQAQKAGVEIELGCRVNNLSLEQDFVRIEAGVGARQARRISARIAVLATGNDYQLHKKAGLGYPKDFLLGIQTELAQAGGKIPTVFIGKDFAPGGFAWAVPAGDMNKIGLVTKARPRCCFRHFVRRFYPDVQPEILSQSSNIKAIAQGLVSHSYGERVLALGEAAGQVKTTTGGGIYYGLHCAQIAAGVILKSYRAGSFHAQRLAEYERLWKASLKKEILVGYYARKIYARLSQSQIERLFELAQTDGILPLVRREGNFDWQSDLLMDLFKRASVFHIVQAVLKRPSFDRRDFS